MLDRAPVLIGIAEDQAEADVWQAFLTAEGVPSLVKNRNPLAYLQAVVPFLPFVLEVYVPRAASGRARRILAPSLKKRKARRTAPLVRRLAWLWFLLGPGQVMFAAILWPATYITHVLR